MKTEDVEALKARVAQKAQALQKLGAKINKGGIGVLWHGSIGAMSATFVGHYPWFFTYNTLQESLPKVERKDSLPKYLARNALIGFCSSAVSDTCSNSVRVVKTTRQTSETQLSYLDSVRLVVAADGWQGLLCRGLGTRLLANAIQSALFAIVWKYIEAELNGAR